jgi:thiol-disulfide isomerase/thioredoxin
MRTCGAPEARGFSSLWSGRATSSAFALVALTTLAVSAVPHGAAWGEPSANSPVRHLTAAPSAAPPLFTLPDLAGAQLKLEAQRGRVVLLHFFATWCEPCREELSSLSHLQLGPRGKQVVVVGVNVAEVPVRVRRFLNAAPVSFPVVLDTDRAVTRAWAVGVLPTTFVLDPTLQPKLFVEGDLDWSRPDVLSTLDAIVAAVSSETSTHHTDREK